MRRGLAGLVLGLSLVVASVSWASFIMSRTILDPGRSERLADQMFENPELRDVLATRLADSVGATLPGDVAVPSETLKIAADLALDNEAVQDLVREGIVETHRAALEGNVEPVVIDGSALGNALRDALVETNPTLGAALPPAPEVSIQLPTSGLNFLGTLKDFVDQFAILSAAAALIGGAVALVITSDRPAVLRRVSFWAFGAATFWLIVGYGMPWVAGQIGPASSAVVTAAIDVFFGAMIPPAFVMAAVGAGLLLLSFVWDGMAVRRPAAVAQPQRVPRRQGPKGTADRLAGADPAPVRPSGIPRHRRSVDRTVVQPRPTVGGARPAGTEPSPRTAPPSAAFDPWAPDMPPPRTDEPPISAGPRRWVEGVGYVDDDES